MFILQQLVNALLVCLPVLIATINPLIYPLTRKQTLVISAVLFMIALLDGNRFSFFFIIAMSTVLILIAIFQKHVVINLSCAIGGYLFSVCLSYLFTSILGLIGYSITTIENTRIFYLLYCIIYDFVLFAITFGMGRLLRKLYLNRQDFSLYSDANRRIALLLFLELLSCLGIFMFNIIYGRLSGYPNQIVLFNSILFGFFFSFTGIILFFIIRILRRYSALTNQLKEAEALQDYTSKIEQLYTEMRTFKHDYINILSSLEIFLNEQKYAELETYFHENILPAGQNLIKEDFTLSQLANITCLEVKGLLYQKIVTALNQKLEITIDIHNEVTEFPMQNCDLVRVLGIFLDNAIEASVESKDKILYIGILAQEEEIILRIRNSCQNVSNINSIFELGISSKSGSRGIGLYNARRIINSYENVILETTYEDKLFTQQMRIIIPTHS